MTKKADKSKQVGFIARSSFPQRSGFFGGNSPGRPKFGNQKFGKIQYRTQHKG